MKKLLRLLVAGLLLTACGEKKTTNADDKKADKSEVQIKEETAAAVKTQSAISRSKKTTVQHRRFLLYLLFFGI